MESGKETRSRFEGDQRRRSDLAARARQSAQPLLGGLERKAPGEGRLIGSRGGSGVASESSVATSGACDRGFRGETFLTATLELR
jgi:hypothetical protein